MKSIETATGPTAKQPESRSPITSKRRTALFDGSTDITVSRERFRFITQAIPVPSVLYKVNFDEKENPIKVIPIAANPAFKKTLEITDESKSNQVMSKFLDEKTKRPLNWLSILGQVAEKRTAQNLVFYSPTNEKYYSAYTFSPNNGYCILSFRDITKQRTQVLKMLIEQKKTEEELRTTAEKCQYLLKYAPAGIYEIDVKTQKFRSINETICKILGYTEQELLSMNPLDLLYPGSRKRFQQRMQNILKGKPVDESVEYRVRTKSGRGIWSIMHVNFLYKDGAIDGALVVAYDVTERKRSQRELLTAERRYRRLYETTQDGIMARDLHGRMIDCNPAYAKMLGYTRKELRSLSVQQLLPEKWHEQRDRIVEKVIQTGRSIVFEREYKRKDGSIFPASVRTWRSTDGKGKVTGIWSIVRDISPQKKLQKNLEEHADILERIVEDREKRLKDTERLVAIGQTAGMVGHDLRNPLQTLTGELYLAKIETDALDDGEPKSNLQESIRVIEEQVAYMDKIVSDLQAFVQPVRIDKKPLDLEELLSTVLNTVIVPPGICVKVDSQGNKVQTRGDPQLLKRVLVNLVTNAIQAMPNGGNLSIGTHVTPAGYVSISVKDTGSGIPDNIRNQIFTPLFTTKPRGQGFGLAVCKRVIEAHGGSITFESAEGKGTNFVIAFPSS